MQIWMGTPRRSPDGRRIIEAGFTYLGVLFLIAVMSAALAAVAVVWSTYSQREREAELLFIGGQFRDAIKSYFASSPGTAQLPKTLDDLVEDKRFPAIRRHLRKIYTDPMTRKTEWGLVQLPGVGIAGVYSLSHDKPISEAGLSAGLAAGASAEAYSDWKFVVDTAALAGAPAGEAATTPAARVPTTPRVGDAQPVQGAGHSTGSSDQAAK